MHPATLALVATFVPLLAFFFALVFFRARHRVAAGIVLAGGAVSLTCSILLLAGGAHATPYTASWLTSGVMDIEFGFLLDATSLVMGVIVALVAFCVQVYSLGYMAHDPGRGRFFALLGLFVWAMLSFVYAANLLQAFIFWELVGLCSFLLIGFWYEKPSAVAAAKKAFIMTRVGDVGLMLGVIYLLFEMGTLDIVTINTLGPGRIPTDILEVICALIFLGIVGKSAQFPLHTWLPDAMEGPTPVSALLHSATMVAAGVFLFARLHPLFMAVPDLLTVVLVISTFTAILAATMAMVANDMKKVLAYSSISQLGYMLMGLAAGGFFAGMFHLTTHAAFKALLFLCAGAYIHYTGSNDMVTIGRAGAAKALKPVTLGLVVGGAALAGIPPLAGFFSKEAIIHQLSATGRSVFAAGALSAAFLTAYYTARMVLLVTRPNAQSDATVDEPADESHAHRGPSPVSMTAPILVLTVFAATLGLFGGPLATFFLGPKGADAAHLDIMGAAPAMALVAAGVLLAWFEFGRANARQLGFVRRFPALWRLFRNRWHIDDVYRTAIIEPVIGFARACFHLEKEGIDRSMDKLAEGTREIGDATASTQTGRVQAYVMCAVLLIATLVLYIGLGGGL